MHSVLCARVPTFRLRQKENVCIPFAWCAYALQSGKDQSHPTVLARIIYRSDIQIKPNGHFSARLERTGGHISRQANMASHHNGHTNTHTRAHYYAHAQSIRSNKGAYRGRIGHNKSIASLLQPLERGEVVKVQPSITFWYWDVIRWGIPFDKMASG